MAERKKSLVNDLPPLSAEELAALHREIADRRVPAAPLEEDIVTA